MKRSLFSLYLLLQVSLILGAQPNVLDNFNTLISRPANVQAIDQQADGKILLAGAINQVDSYFCEPIVRLHANGQPDNSFQPRFGDTVVTALAVQNDQKILVGGYIEDQEEETGILFRLLPDGSLDPGFAVDTFSKRVLVIEQLDNDRIVVGGVFGSYGTLPSTGMLMLNTNGSVFRTFTISENNSNLFVNAIHEAGNDFYIGGHTGSDAQFLRFSNSGQIDNSFVIDESVGANNFMTIVSHIDQLNNGNLVFTTYTWEFDPRLVVVDPSGQRVYSISIPNPLGLTVTQADQIIVSGEWQGRPDAYLVDSSGLSPFIPGKEADDQVYELLTLDNGNILVTGRFGYFKGMVREGVALMSPLRSLRSDFQPAVKRPGQVNQVLYLSSGKTLIAGDFSQVNYHRIINLARLNPDGSLDPSFLQTSVPSDKDVRAIEVLSNGKIMVGSSSSSLDPEIKKPIFRLNPDGSQDSTFQIADQINIIGNVKGFTPLPNGRVIVHGALNLLMGNTLVQQIAIFNANGSLDPVLSSSFRGGTVSDVHLRGEELIIVGNKIRLNNLEPAAARVISLSGIPNHTFVTSLDAQSQIETITRLRQGGFLLSGQLYDGIAYRELMKVKADGSQDHSFNWPIFSADEAPESPPRAILELSNGDLAITNFSREEKNQITIIDPQGNTKEGIIQEADGSFFDFESVDDSTIFIGGAFAYGNSQSSLLKVQYSGSPPTNNQNGPLLLVSGGAARVGESICLSVSADDIEGLLGIQMEIEYDPNLLHFERLDDLTGLPGLSQSDFGLPGSSNNPAGTIRLAWLDPELSGFTLEDTTALFTLCFSTIAPTTGTEVRIVNYELVNDQDEVIAARTYSDPIVITNEDSPSLDTVSVHLAGGTVTEGEVICIPVTVSNFEEVMGLQFDINYDPTKLQYQSLQNFNLPGLNVSTFGVPGSGANIEGRIRMAWFDMQLDGVTVPDQTVIFEMCFIALADRGTTQLSFSNVEVVKDINAEVGFHSEAGIIAFEASEEPVRDPTRMVINDGSVRKGEVICVPLIVEDFTDLIGMGFVLNYNPEQLVFQSIKQYNLPNLNQDFFKLPGAGTMPLGQLEMTWFDFTEQGVSVPDQTAIFEACFLVLADTGSTEISLSEVVVIGEDGTQRPFQTQSGTFALLPDGDPPGADDFLLEISSDSVLVGEEVCLQFTTKNFTDIIGLQFTVNYDTNILHFDSLINFNLAGLAGSIGLPGEGNNPSGQLKVAWIDANIEGLSLPDSSVLFEICFSATAVGTTSLAFSGVEITDLENDNVVFSIQSGTVVVEEDNSGGGTDYNNDNFTLISSGITTTVDDFFCLPIRVRDFDGIKRLNFSYYYDPQLITYNAVINPALSGLAESIEVINTGSDNLAGIRINWVDQTGNGISLPDDAILMEVCFTAKETGVSTVAFGNATVIDANNNSVSFNGENAFVTIESATGNGTDFFTFRVASDTVAMGESFCLDVSIENFTNVLGMQLNIDYDPELLLFEGVQNFNLSSLDTGSFEFPGSNALEPGRIRLSWIDQNLQGVTLVDGTIIFQICFQARQQNVIGTVSMSEPNVLDVSGNVLNFLGVGAIITVEDRMVTSTNNVNDPQDRFHLYPVPTHDELVVATKNTAFKQTPFRIVDQQGAIVQQGELNDYQTSLSVNQLAKGLYHLIIFEDSKYWNLSFIKL